MKRWKQVALPSSYGSWSLVSEPILLGLLVDPSWPGLFLALGGFFSFLIYQPIKIIMADRRRGRTFERTLLAGQAALVYLFLLLLSFSMAIWPAGLRPLLPLIMAGPLMVIYVIYEQRSGRSWQAELAAPAAFSAISAAIVLGSGWHIAAALALWLLMIGRAVPAVLYVRARLRLSKGLPSKAVPAIAAHFLALIVVVLLFLASLVPWTAIPAFIILFLRAFGGLSQFRRDVAPMTLGWVETGIGLSIVLMIAAGYWLAA